MSSKSLRLPSPCSVGIARLDGDVKCGPAIFFVFSLFIFAQEKITSAVSYVLVGRDACMGIS